MKTLSINGTNLNALSVYAYQYPSGKRELRVTLPQDAIEYADLKALLKSHDGDIVLTKEDGTTETFVGYKTTASITDKVENETEVFYVVLDCVGEAERKALEAEAKAKEAEATAQALAELVEQQKQTLEALNQQLLVTQLAVVEMHEASKSEPDVVKLTESEGE